MSSEFDPRITAYFGDAVLRAGFMAVPHLFMRHYRQLGLSATHAMFLLQIMESTWDLAEAPKTTGDLARRMDVDKRTIRKYTEEVVELGLVVLYDQFDASGAQIENGYDLSPLFDRLARFAPEPTPGGAVRRRVARGTESAHDAPDVAAASQTIRPSPGPNDPPLPRPKRSAPPPAQTIRPSPDREIQAPRSGRSGLKRNQRIAKNQETCLMHDTGSVMREQSSHFDIPQSHSGWSLRWNQPLTKGEVQQSNTLLQCMGIDNPVRALIAPSLAPAEVWALHTYSVAKNWQPALLVSQVYDKASKQPQMAAFLHAQYDHVGRQLATLDPEVAATLLQLVSAHCPHTPHAVRSDALVVSNGLQAIAEDVWSMVAGLRGHRGSMLNAYRGVPAQPAAASQDAQACEKLWEAAIALLKGQLAAADVDIWLVPARLLAVEANRAVIGADNVFVREQIEQRYQELVRGTLQSLVGQPLEVQVVVGCL